MRDLSYEVMLKCFSVANEMSDIRKKKTLEGVDMRRSHRVSKAIRYGDESLLVEIMEEEVRGGGMEKYNLE